jgi:hypothetical protein
VKRFILPSLINFLVPGTGLIVLGCPWLGVALAAWFVLGAEVSLLGLYFAPAAIPDMLVLVGVIFSLAAWGVAQGLLYRRFQLLRDPDLPGELGCLRVFAEQAMSQQDYKSARSALLMALSIDDTDLPTRILWARLLTLSASRPRACRAWRRAERLDSHAQYTCQIQEALDQLHAV